MQSEPTSASKTLALDRTCSCTAVHTPRGADKPDAVPHPMDQWSVIEAPRVARAYHGRSVERGRVTGARPKGLG